MSSNNPIEIPLKERAMVELVGWLAIMGEPLTNEQLTLVRDLIEEVKEGGG